MGAKASLGPVLAGAALLAFQAVARAAPTVAELPLSNGFGAGAYSLDSHRLTTFARHLYASFNPGVVTTDWCYDSFWGLRADGNNRWLAGEREVEVSYLEGTGILKVVHRHQDLLLESYWFAPFSAPAPVLLSVSMITNLGSLPLPDSGAFLLFNFHLGEGDGTKGELIRYQAASLAFIEAGRADAPVAIYRALVAPDRHGATPQNPYDLVLAGGEMVNVEQAGPTDDVVAGFQFDVPEDGVLQPGESFWAGAAVALADPTEVDSTLAGLEALLANARPRDLLIGEIAFWDEWHQKDRLPEGLSRDERELARSALAFLKMAQVREPAGPGGSPTGQLLASLPPGQWNISWVRDAAYGILALNRSGHPEEAAAAVRFMLAADVGYYQSQVGAPYGVSVCRYFGSGLEWSDENQDGPNIEFDDFGLFLLALEAVWNASADENLLAEAWPVASAGAADVLVSLIEEGSGLLRPDSSIWEHHWNGRQKRFTYSSAVGAAGLCAASRMAARMGDVERASSYARAALALQEGVRSRLVDPNQVLAGNREELLSGANYLDAAAVEAFLFNLIAANDPVASATFDALDAALRLPSGGLMRNDDGEWYDSQEWVMVDLRVSALAFLLRKAGRGQELLERITRLTRENLGLFPELFLAGTDTVAGAVPMAGFGAGAYLLSLWARAQPEPPPFCGSPQPDGGSPDGDGTEAQDDGGDPAADQGVLEDDGKPGVHPPGCGCGGRGGLAADLGLAALLVARRYRRKEPR